jgi:hypothetical protein
MAAKKATKAKKVKIKDLKPKKSPKGGTASRERAS